MAAAAVQRRGDRRAREDRERERGRGDACEREARVKARGRRGRSEVNHRRTRRCARAGGVHDAAIEGGADSRPRRAAKRPAAGIARCGSLYSRLSAPPGASRYGQIVWRPSFSDERSPIVSRAAFRPRHRSTTTDALASARSLAREATPGAPVDLTGRHVRRGEGAARSLRPGSVSLALARPRVGTPLSPLVQTVADPPRLNVAFSRFPPRPSARFPQAMRGADGAKSAFNDPTRGGAVPAGREAPPRSCSARARARRSIPVPPRAGTSSGSAASVRVSARAS